MARAQEPGGPPPTVARVGEAVAVAWGGDVALATGLAEMADQPQAWPGLGRRAVGPVRIVVAHDAMRYALLARGRAPAWGAGLALPGARLVMLRADGGDLRQLLRHELAHLVLRDAIRSRVPLWFDEGYAGWASDGPGTFERLALNLALLQGRVATLADVDRGLRAGELEAGTSYALAASAVGELARRAPGHTLEPLLTRLAAGEPFDDAVLATTGLRIDRFDELWQVQVRRQFGWLAWIGTGGLWAAAGIAVVLAAHLRRRRDAPRRAALDQGWVVPPDQEGEAADLAQPQPLDPRAARE